jgi:hypothetical protein
MGEIIVVFSRFQLFIEKLWDVLQRCSHHILSENGLTGSSISIVPCVPLAFWENKPRNPGTRIPFDRERYHPHAARNTRLAASQTV